MALALGESIAKKGWDLKDQAERYVAWWRSGAYSVNGRCFDIGIATSNALSRFEETGDPRSSGSTNERSSGNGGIMRIAPVPIHYAELLEADVERFIRLAAESSLVTHASPQCLSAARYFALVLAGLIAGESREEVLSDNWWALDRLESLEPLHQEIRAVAGGSFRTTGPPEIRGSGYVVKSLEAALWAFHDAAGFEEAVLKAVNLGDDSDTTGAVCGQLAGACWGESGMRASLREGLARREMIEGIGLI